MKINAIAPPPQNLRNCGNQNNYENTNTMQKKQSDRSHSPKAPLKWVGGKTKLLPTIEKYLPDKISNYFEPFLGGGAVMLHLLQNNRIDGSVVASDQCGELMNFWRSLNNEHRSLAMTIKCFAAGGFTEADYYKIRAWDRCDDFLSVPAICRAARFWLLNHYGYKGLCRYNQKGEFNSPWGHYKSVELPSIEDFKHWQSIISFVDFKRSSFEPQLTRDYLPPDSFAYIDPPYEPIVKNGFTGYSGKWGKEEQGDLLNCLKFWDNNKGKFMLSAHDEPAIVRDYTSAGFSVLEIHLVDAPRAIGTNGEQRSAKELLICNY